MIQRKTKKNMMTPSAFFDMADTFRNKYDEDTQEQVSVRRNNRRKSKAKLKTFSYNKDENPTDVWDIPKEWDDEDNFEKFTKRR